MTAYVLPGVRPAVVAGTSSCTAPLPLRIAQLAGPLVRVPPHGYGGIEWMVSALTEELVRRGHEVTLVASGDSQTAARLIAPVDVAVWQHSRYQDALPFIMMGIDDVYRRAAEFDVIHNHAGYLAFPAARAQPITPTVTTLHSRLDAPEHRPLFQHFADLPLVSISDAQRLPLPHANWMATVHHGVDLDMFGYQPAHRGYLAFMGRIASEKGVDTAIRVARRAGMPLKIAARMPLDQPNNPESQHDWQYYREVIAPLLQQPGVEYVGEVGGATKVEFLSGAAALLFPIRWPEPFGLVMPEALACGTPVLALRCGSVPEVIEDGVTGFVVDDEDGLVQAVQRLPTIERRDCRTAAETRFSVGVMADQYEQIYRRLIGSDGAAQQPRRTALPSPLAKRR